ncbi:MAG: prepilin-type N-terminal cleavage/methylation domain-containing protein [bacterium]|nr:prepilin-type N-terminal cleavage/methylation domain-containing protein [bacterium]
MKKNNRGISLIELLVASAILAIGLIPLVTVMMYGLNTSNRAHKMTRATNLSREMAEEIRSQAFSEEFVYGQRDPACDLNTSYPEKENAAQCFGLESGENIDTASNGGRMTVYDDVDDYHGWCRGVDCGGAKTSLEDFDGTLHGSQEGLWFTRRVRVHNLSVAGRHISSFYKDPFESYTSTDSRQNIRRFNFENWSSDFTQKDGDVASGLTWLKRIEVTVIYNGPTVKGVGVVDVSYAVMPRALL